jgi:hypothetical protein
MSEPSSPCLVKYRALCHQPAPPEIRESTWTILAAWIGDHVAQDALVETYREMLKELGPISQAKEGTPAGLLAEAIRDAADVVWYALDEEHLEMLDEVVAELAKLPAENNPQPE